MNWAGGELLVLWMLGKVAAERVKPTMWRRRVRGSWRKKVYGVRIARRAVRRERSVVVVVREGIVGLWEVGDLPLLQP